MSGFNIGSVYAKLEADISDFEKGMNQAEKKVDSFGNHLKNIGSGIAEFGKQAAIFSGVVGAGLTLFLKDASQEASNFEKAMTTLDIISGRFGVSGTQAQQAAQKLGKELRIGTGAAAEGLQNLLKSGLNLEQSTELLKRFTNEAITGKSPTISLSQAVQNLSFAYATGNSALGNLSGISENFVNITEKGREALLKEGKSASQITDEMAKFRGMMDLTNLTMGSSERFAGTLIDKQAELSQKILELKIAIGQALNPALSQLVGLFSNSGLIEAIQNFSTSVLPNLLNKVTDFAKWVNENKETIIPFLQALAVGFGALTVIGTISALLVALTSPLTLVAVAIGALYYAWNTNFFGIRDTTTRVITEIVTFWNEYLKPALDMLMNWWAENSAVIIIILQGAFEIITAIFTTAFNIIYGLVKLFLALLAGDWGKAWEVVKQLTTDAFKGINDIFNAALDSLRRIGDLIFNAIKEPFEKAWNTVKEKMNQIKDAVDFTKRHSPSVVDIVNKGVNAVNNAMSNLDFGVNASVNAATVPASNIAGRNAVIGVNISLDGAVIADQAGAMRISEVIGDGIIRKLQHNLRF